LSASPVAKVESPTLDDDLARLDPDPSRQLAVARSRIATRRARRARRRPRGASARRRRASTASPANFSTVPAVALDVRRARVEEAVTRAPDDLGSLAETSAVESTRSTNRRGRELALHAEV
jgi:hypothetical protein